MMATTAEVIAMLPTVPEEEQEELLQEVSTYQKERAVLRNWRLGDSLVDANIRQNATFKLAGVERRLKETAHGRLLLTLLMDEAKALDTAAQIDRALKTWLEE